MTLALTAPDGFVPANDNQPRPAASFADLSERRAWLASLPMPENDSDIPQVLGCPTLARLSKAGDQRRLVAMAWWINSTRALQIPNSIQAANDNQAKEDEANAAQPPDAAEKLAVDLLLDIRPTVNELMSASGRVSVRCKRSSYGAWSKLERHQNQLVVGKHRSKSKLPVGKDEIVGWFDRNGIERRAEMKLAGPKGGAKKVRSAADITRYLDRPGSPFPSQWLAFDGGRRWDRTDQALAAERVLNEAIANTRVMPSVKRDAKAVVAHGAYFIGGTVASTGGSGGMLDAAAIEAELARTGTARRVRAKLGEDTAVVLDLATTRMTAEQIGTEFGYTGQYARRWAVKAIDAALDQIAA
ncbi:hypothetical protein SAMN05428969_2833 [Devosia sp. YR412]|uniref:hypothetical protein n=1 Tax=Devosia sp. YR412 TaxID=1881030 RepID=UPI0008B15944|nr:hypothetical protein [Devosia sp. YR412]SEQ37960.1 hypothetical protein SAMN05428969_2833 [Devosia sp. YR412]